MGVKIKNIDRLLTKTNKISDLDLTPVITECTLLVEGQAKLLCPVDTGNLRGSIHPEVKKDNNNVYGRVYSNAGHAPYIEFGTGPKGNGTYPFRIKGLSLKYRHTKWCYTKDGGETFRWTSGQEARPFMYPALEMNKKKIQKKIEDAFKEHVIKSIGGSK